MLIGKNNRQQEESIDIIICSLVFIDFQERPYTSFPKKRRVLKHMAQLFVYRVLLCHKMGSYIFSVVILRCPT